MYIFGARLEGLNLDVSFDSQGFLINHNPMKEWGSAGIAPYIINLVSEWMRGAWFMLRHLYSWVNSKRYVLNSIISWKGMDMRKNFDLLIINLKGFLLLLPHCLRHRSQPEMLLSLEIVASCTAIWDAGFERHRRRNVYFRRDSSEWRLWDLAPWRLCSVRRFDLLTGNTSRLLRGWWTGKKKTLSQSVMWDFGWC